MCSPMPDVPDEVWAEVDADMNATQENAGAEQLAHHTAEMLDWASGRKSYNNTFIGLHGDRSWELAMCAAADAAEVAKHSAVVQALSNVSYRAG